MSCKKQDDCANFEKACFKCFSYGMYQPQKELMRLQHKSMSRKQKKEGAELERSGVNSYRKAIRTGKQLASQQIASGALPFALGDMITEEQLTAAIAEFKERGETDSRGEKQITIKKEWLDKLEHEARMMKRDYYFLPFSFKNDGAKYVVMNYNVLLSYVQWIQYFIQKTSDMDSL